MSGTSRDWMFCPLSGYLLQLDANTGAAVCTLSGFRRDLAELESVRVVTKSDMQDYRRRFNLEPLVKTVDDQRMVQNRKRATVDEPCPKCKHQGLEFYTMQLRSADEGQTVFYECTNCGHKFSQNT